MLELTIDDLRTTLRECAGADDVVDLDGDILDMSFADLGYDSLALLETTAVIGRRRDIRFNDDIVIEATTPRLLIAYVNEALSAPVA